jgi:hypothetical protein
MSAQFIQQAAQRTEIRQRYGIEGSSWGDCWRALCCSNSDLLQQDNEVRIRENERQAFVSQQPGMNSRMTYER